VAPSTMPYKTRDRLRSRDTHPHGFMPSLAVERPVLISPAEAAEVKQRMIDNLKENLPRTQAARFRVLNPQDWKVTHIERDSFVNYMYSAKARPTALEISKLAGAAKAGLRELIADVPPEIDLPLEPPARFGAGQRKREIGVSPHEHGSIDLLVAENELCVNAIANNIPNTNLALYEELSRPPYVPIVRTKRAISEDDMRRVAPILKAAMPASLTLGDPVVSFMPDRAYEERPFESVVRPIDLTQPLVA